MIKTKHQTSKKKYYKQRVLIIKKQLKTNHHGIHKQNKSDDYRTIKLKKISSYAQNNYSYLN